MGNSLAWIFRHNVWANLRLLEACAGLSAAQLDLTAPGTYGTAGATLVHLLAAEQRYVEGLTGTPYAQPWREAQGVPDFDYLRRTAQDSGAALVEIAQTTAPETICRGTRRGEPFAIPAIVFLLQAINHATEHRGHIVSILNQNGVETPPLDGWAFEAEIRTALGQD